LKSKAITKDTGTASFRRPERSRRVAAAASIALACAAPAFAQSAGPATGGTGAPGDTTTTGTPGLSGNAGSGISVPDLSGGTPRSVRAPIFEFGVRSTLGYSDNLELRPPGQEVSETVLAISPYIEARSDAPLAQYSVYYQMSNFARFNDNGTDWDTRHGLNANGSFALYEDNLWLDASAFSGQVATSIEGAMSINQSTSFANVSDYTWYSISPWYQDRLGSWATYNLRYSYAKSGNDDALLLANSDQTASASFTGVDVGRAWNWTWFGTFERDDFGNDVTRDRRNSEARIYYRFNDRFRVFGGAHYEQIDFVFNEDGEDRGWGGAAGFDWNPNSRLSLSGYASNRYYGTVGNASASWNMPRSALGVAYSRALNTSSTPSSLSLDPFALTSNPAGTPSSVTGILGDTGVVPPGGIPLNAAYVTDAAVVEDSVTAFWGLRGPSRSLTLSAWLRDSETANQLLGSGGATTRFTGKVRERGSQLLFSQSLAANSRGEIALDYRVNDSPTLDFENRLTTLRALLYNDIGPRTTVFAGIRIARQRATGGGTEYDENAIFGGLDYRIR
jgi:uncharacterized protein (PEP-CTERM system associated)